MPAPPRPTQLRFEPEVYGQLDSYTPDKLTRVLSYSHWNEGVLNERVPNLLTSRPQVPVQPLVQDCMNMIWMGDHFQGKSPEGVEPPYLGPERRKTCLAFMWAIQHGGAIEDGERAVERARHMAYQHLFDIYALEALQSVTAVAALGGIGVGAAYLGGATLSAVKQGWAAGTAAGKAKVLGAAVGGTLGLAGLAGAALAVGGMAYGNHQRREQEREMLHQEQYGRDALFCELVTRRRYRRHLVQP